MNWGILLIYKIPLTLSHFHVLLCRQGMPVIRRADTQVCPYTQSFDLCGQIFVLHPIFEITNNFNKIKMAFFVQKKIIKSIISIGYKNHWYTRTAHNFLPAQVAIFWYAIYHLCRGRPVCLPFCCVSALLFRTTCILNDKIILKPLNTQNFFIWKSYFNQNQSSSMK